MSGLKTQANDASTTAFLECIADPQKRKDCERIYAIMKEITLSKPVMWGESIIGFGSYHYVYDSGREGDWFLTGFSPRKQNISLYIMSGLAKYPELLEKLGKHTTGKSCLYIKKLADVDESVLKQLIEASVKSLSEKYPQRPSD